MSINFATLQDLTIPEGVVTEIKDASGNVLWQAIRNYIDTLYLRPSADISFTGAKYPEDLAYGYLAISEKVADGYATYIGESKQAMNNAYASAEGTFALTLDENVSIKKILNGEIGVVYSLSDGDVYTQPETSGITVQVNVLGSVYELINVSDDGNELYNGLRTLTIPNGMITSLNSYLNANGALPDISLYLLVKCERHLDGSQKATSSAKIDQAYLALECECTG